MNAGYWTQANSPMTYYEELGVPQDATPDEIRRAYRCLAKLLHPDQQQDERLRQAAERQMRRLNEILSILTNERSRMAYDDSVAVLTGTARRAFPLLKGRKLSITRAAGEWAVREWHLVLAGLVCAGSLVWYLSTSPPAPPPFYTSAVSQRPPLPVTKKKPIRTRKRQRTKRTKEAPKEAPRIFDREPAKVGEPVKAPEPEVPDPPEPALPQVPVAVRPSSLAKTVVAAPKPEPKVAARPAKDTSLLGTWLFVPSSNHDKPKLPFEALYIEMVVINDEPGLRGRYRGRYRAPDSASLAEVSFTFEGKSGGDFHWSSVNGVEGKGSLKLLTAESVEVNWWTTIAPQEPLLVSGTAVLIKLRAR